MRRMRTQVPPEQGLRGGEKLWRREESESGFLAWHFDQTFHPFTVPTMISSFDL